MKKASLLREERAEHLEAQEALVKLMTEEKRDLTAEESETFKSLTEKVNRLAVDIPQAEQIEAAEIRIAEAKMNQPKAKDGKSEFEGFSFARMVSNIVSGKPQTGAEKAVADLGERMAKDSGNGVTGTAIPVGALARAISVVAGNGEKWVEDLDGGFIEALRDRMVLPGLGARTLGNLTGDIFLPRLIGGSASWNTETGTASDSGQDTDNVTMSPKRVAATTIVSSQFLKQSSPDADRILTDDLLDAIAVAVDYAGINGGGTNEPNGILNTPGIGDVAIGTNGGAVTWDHILQLESAVATGNASKGSLNYLTNPAVRAALKAESLDAGSGRMVWEGMTVNGYNAEISNGVPNDLTKGTASGTCSALIYGNFNDVVIGQWGVLDVIVDPYTNAKTGQVEITVNGFFDVAVRQPKSFAAVLDILPTA